MTKKPQQQELTDKQRVLLEPFEKHFLAMFQAVIAMSDDELTAILEAAAIPNQTNCWFITFWAANFVAAQAGAERYSRARTAGRAALAATKQEAGE